MNGDLISVNGRLCRPGEAGMAPDSLLAANFIWQRMHTIGHRALHVSVHTELADTAYASLYGSATGLSTGMLAEETALLLRANRYPKGSAAVMLYLMPDEDGKPIRILSCEKQLLYKGYALWHTAENALILPYECPFPHFATAVSLAADTYAANYARRKGAGMAIAENNFGHLYGAGGGPLFAVIGNRVLTTPIEQGACDSVERRLVTASCVIAGLEIVETPLTRDPANEYQELFAANAGGIVSINECMGNIYPNSTASRIVAAMNRFVTRDL